ncbi:MAG: hypothetical protein JNL90_16380 [Planctomycetes bacterium]|nr:hypothetical protein [Planctomycetota bacterium]
MERTRAERSSGAGGGVVRERCRWSRAGALLGLLAAVVAGGCTKARALSPDEQQAQVAPAKPGTAATVYTVKVPGVG